MEPPGPNAEEVWQNVLVNIVKFMSPNDIACGIRLTNTAAAAQFRGRQHTTIHVSQPCLPYEFERRWGAEGAVEKMTIKQRRRLVCLAISSGVRENVELAYTVAGCVPTEEMMEAAAASGKPELCDMLLEAGCAWGKALPAAERAGHWNVFDHLLTRGYPCCVDDAYAALSRGNARFLDWLELRGAGALRELPDYRVVKLLAAAAEGCNLRTFQELYAQWTTVDDSSDAAPAAAAAEHGGLLAGGRGLLAGGRGPATLQRQHQLLLLRDSHRQLVLAAAAGSPTPDWRAKVEWLETQPRYRRGPSIAAAAAAATDGMERLDWLRQRGYIMEPAGFESTTFEAAGRQGNIDVVRHLLTEFALYHRARVAAEEAAEAGQLAFLQALHAVCALSSEDGQAVAVRAARAGHQSVVAWAVEALLGSDVLLLAGVEEQQELLAAAAESGSVELLDWVWARLGAPQQQVAGAGAGADRRLSRRGLEGAVKGGCRAALEWMAKRGFLAPEVALEDPTPLYVLAAQNGDRATIRWLRLHLPGDGRLPDGLQHRIAAAAGHFSSQILGWLVADAGAAVERGLEGVGPGAGPGVHGWLAGYPFRLNTCSTGLTSNASLDHHVVQQHN